MDCSFALLLVFCLGLTPKPKPSPVARPNIVFILADDLGWADLGCYGNQFNETPALDALAAQGILFTQAYATCPVCSPSRASIMTGKTPVATGITDWLPGRKLTTGPVASDRLLAADTQQHLALAETTLAEVLRAQGYATGLFGKWHLGGPGHFPEQQGFEVAVGKPHGGSPLSYFYPYQNKNAQSEDLNLGGQPGEYLTDRLTDEALKFMGQHQDRPFFAFISHHAVHTPIVAKPELVEKYRQNLQGGPEEAPRNPRYAALLESLDQSVGKIMAFLTANGLAERTIVVFTSDNGGLAVEEGPHTPATLNTPLRQGKGHVYEGGVRVPLLMRVPGVPPHRQAGPVWGADFYPTLLALAQVPVPNPQAVEGANFARQLTSLGKKAPRRTLYWHYPHYSNQRGKPAAAIREGDWKLVQHYENEQIELYNLATDPGEQTDLRAQYAQRAAKLLAKLDAWRRKYGAVLPTPRN